MDIQEKIEDAGSIEEVEKMKEEIIHKIQSLNRDLEKAFEEEELTRVKEDLLTLKFHLNILENIENKIYFKRH